MGGGQPRQLADGDSIRGSCLSSIASPSRTIGTIFQPSTSSPVELAYLVRVVSTSSLLGGTQGGRAKLLVGATSPPTIIADQVGGGAGGVLVVGLTVIDVVEDVMKFLLPPGWFAQISTETDATMSAAPTYTITTLYEATY